MSSIKLKMKSQFEKGIENLTMAHRSKFNVQKISFEKKLRLMDVKVKELKNKNPFWITL